MTKKEEDFTADEVVAHAKANHIWLNAFGCLAPSDRFLRDVGQMVVERVMESEMRDDLTGTTRVAYLRINAS